jgi:uncharacterized Zn-binding protein involved in type VI secretion
MLLDLKSFFEDAKNAEEANNASSNGSGIVRVGDTTYGHRGFYPIRALSGSKKHFVEGRGIVRVGDSFGFHCARNKGCHNSNAAIPKQRKWYCEGALIMTKGSRLTCSDIIATGSNKFFAF